MFNATRQQLFMRLWRGYVKFVPYFYDIFKGNLGVSDKPILDHLAIIDLPSKRSGISYLKNLLANFAMHQRGAGYLPEKCNDFVWFAYDGIEEEEADKALLQPIFADFRLDGLSRKNRDIINKYLHNVDEFNYSAMANFAKGAFAGNKDDEEKLLQLTVDELTSRPWDVPTTRDYLSVYEENQLVAWVLLNGRKVNHFGISMHFDPNYKNLGEFNNHIANS